MASWSANSRPGFRFEDSCCARLCPENTFKIFTLDSRPPTFNNPRMSAKLTVGFLGAGKMATALAKGLVQAKLVNAGQIIASDPIEAARSAFAKEVGVKATASNLEVTQSAPVLVLAVKPDQVAGVLKEIRGRITGKHLLCSIATAVWPPVCRGTWRRNSRRKRCSGARKWRWKPASTPARSRTW